MMIEQNTNYAYKMKYMANPTFDKVRELSAKFYLELPQELKDELYEALHRGIDILDSEPQMTAYIFAYGKMHQAKLNYAFDKLSDNFFEHEEINIIDYGCGQAIGTMCYADFLRKNHYSQKIKTITLIEPSEICLKRAALHTSVFFPDAEIKTVNKGFNDLNEKDIICSEETPTLHILSNVLDILNFDIYNFAELIKNNLKGKNQFVCVAPYYNGNEKDNRMDLFASIINGSNIITRKYKANEFIPEKEWTCKISCFQKNIGSFEMIEDSGLEQHTIYYEADKKLDGKWIDENSILHEFDDGKGYLVLKDGVFSINGKIFKDSIGLKSLTLPPSVTKIEIPYWTSNEFKEILPNNVLDKLTEVYESHTIYYEATQKLENFVLQRDSFIPSWVEENSIFHEFSDGKGIVRLQDNVTEIGDNAFFNRRELISIIIPDTITEICSGAFGSCDSLKSIAIPNSVKVIWGNSFSGCSGLSGELIIPDSVTIIGGNAFLGCNGLTSLTIGKSVEHIGGDAFNGCFVTTVNYNATNCNDAGNFQESTTFGICPSFATLNIGNNVKIIPSYAFYRARNLKSIVIPDSVIAIGDCAFCGCSDLTSIVVAKDNKFYNSRNNCNAIIETATNKLVAGCMNTIIPNSVTEIGRSAFRDYRGLTSINIPDSVTEIGAYAFFGCSGLTSINIPDSVTEIGAYAFFGCSGLTSINIPDSVTEIGAYAFFVCSGLTSLTIGKSVEHIGGDAFNGCFVTTVNYNATNCNDAGNFQESTTFGICPSFATLNIGNNVKIIPSYAFYRARNLKSIVIPDSVIAIGDCAFCGCSDLTSIVVAKDNKFYNSRNNCNAIIETATNKLVAGCMNTIIPNSVTEIGRSAFYDCRGLTSINIPDSVTEIGAYAFYDCRGLTSINIPDSVTEIGGQAFSRCSGLTSITFPNSVTSIGVLAFHCCFNLTTISIPDSVTEIGTDAFLACESLKEIIIPKGTRDKFEKLLADYKDKLVEE